MPRLFRSSLLVVAFVLFLSSRSSPQSKSPKPQQPRVVLDLQKPGAGERSFPAARFGTTCHPSGPGDSLYQDLERPTSISELLGAPVEVVRIRHYNRGWKKPDDVRKHVSKLLEAQTGAVYQYEAWDEMVFADIVAAIRFSDGSEGTLEESGGHVCFTNHSKAALWARISLN